MAGQATLSIPVGRKGCSLIPIYGIFGPAANVDYYQIEWSNDDAATWHGMPPAAMGGFPRFYWGPSLTDDPGNLHNVQFLPALIGEHWVIETREHFEARHEPETWGVTRFWVRNRDLLFLWLAESSFAPMDYHLRMKGWTSTGERLDCSHTVPSRHDAAGVWLTIDPNDPLLASVCDPNMPHNKNQILPSPEFSLARTDAFADEDANAPVSIEIRVNYADGRTEERDLPISDGENIASDLLSLLNLLPETALPLKEALAQFRGVRRKFGKTRNRRL